LRRVIPAQRGAQFKLSSTGQNPCGPLAGNRDRDRRPCEGFSWTKRRPAGGQCANRAPLNRGAVVRAGGGSTDFSLWVSVSVRRLQELAKIKWNPTD
jgi:hypothetical protein